MTYYRASWDGKRLIYDDPEPREPRPGRMERALDAGYEPHRDDMAPVPAHLTDIPADDPWAVGLQMARIQAHEMTCPDCARRCGICEDRMCATWGPEPAPRCADHPECVVCAEIPTCRECVAVIREHYEGSDW